MNPELAKREVWQSWCRWTTAGEFAGFLAPALAGALASSSGLFVLAGVIEGAVLGTAQAVVLRGHVADAHLWVWANALAWSAGLLVFAAVTTPLWQPGQSPALVALIGALGGLLMAATMAAVTGIALTRLLSRKPAAAPRTSDRGNTGAGPLVPPPAALDPWESPRPPPEAERAWWQTPSPARSRDRR